MSLKADLEVLGDELVFKVAYRGQPKIVFNARIFNCLFNGVESMSINAGQSVEVSINPRDSYGNAARIDGIPAWTISDEALATLEVSPSGLSARVNSTGIAGTVFVGVSVDADLSEGIRQLSGTATLEILAGEAVDLSVAVTPIVIEVTPVVEAQAPTAEPALADPTLVDPAPTEEPAPVDSTAPTADPALADPTLVDPTV